MMPRSHRAACSSTSRCLLSARCKGCGGELLSAGWRALLVLAFGSDASVTFCIGGAAMAQTADAQLKAWQEVLTTGHPRLKRMQKLMRLLPGPPRCKICNNPFGGVGGHICRLAGFRPS